MFGTVSDMRVAVLTVDGMFDSGLTAILDILNTANALSGQVDLPAPPFEVIPAGREDSVRTVVPDRLGRRPSRIV